MNRFINKVFCGDALDLLRVIPTESIDAVITDAMYGTAKDCRYNWGLDPAGGDPVKHWQYHAPIYAACLRILKPGGVLAWGQGIKFAGHFPAWFGTHALWPLARRGRRCRNWISCQLWVVRSKEGKAIPLPSHYKLIEPDTDPLPYVHPCPKPLGELLFLVQALTKPGDLVLDCFCGLGSTLLACRQLGRAWVGCDKSRLYCQVAMKRLSEARVEQQIGVRITTTEEKAK
jgi:DNA modification methylase